MTTIKATDLEEGSVFRKPGQRKWRIAAKVEPLESHLTDDGEPGILVCLHDCSQIILSQAEVVNCPSWPGQIDRDGFAKLGRRRAAERLRKQ